MSYDWRPNYESPGLQASGHDAEDGTSYGGHGPPPPIPPRPPGFGYQPLPAESQASAAHIRDEQPHTSRVSSKEPQATSCSDCSVAYLQSRVLTEVTDSGQTESRSPAGAEGKLSDHAISSHQHAPPALRLQPVTECIGLPVGFATTWYTHPSAPNYYICSYCYEENIRHTIFKNAFNGAYLDDGKIKMCLYNRARTKDRLMKDAIARGSLAEVVSFLSLRANISPCAGTDGVKGPNPSGHWYCVRGNQAPGMVVCRACYEDYILAQHFAINFEPAPAQPAENAWSCDMAVAFIADEYKRCAEMNDWSRFINGVNARLKVQQCPGAKEIYPEGGGKQWFEPIDGPSGFLICLACYYDCIHNTSEQIKWRDIGPNAVSIYGVSVKCCFGGFSMGIAANRTLRETFDYNMFWTVVRTLAREPECSPNGTTDATWYTLKTDPDHYAICRACYVAIIETWGISDFFKPKPSLPKTAKVLCYLNTGIPRHPFYIAKTLELVLTRDPTSLTEFATTFGGMPLCKQDNDFQNGIWYGWPACTICPECHHFFIKGTALEGRMPLQREQISGSRMCEMYSPRMRKMYLEACTSNPPDPTELLTFSLERRRVYVATMPQWRQMLSNQRLKLAQQQYKSNQSLFYSNLGRTYANTVGYTHTFGQAGVGYGFRNEWELDGARLGQQAAAMGVDIRNSSWTIPAGELESRWRQVE